MNRNYLKSAFFSFIFSLISFMGFLVAFLFSGAKINVSTILNIDINNINFAFLSIILFIFLSLISFLTGVLDITSYFVEQKQFKHSFFKNCFYIFIFTFLPFYILFHWYFLVIQLIISKRFFRKSGFKQTLKSFVFFIFIIGVLTPIWILGLISAKEITTKIVLKTLGYAPITEFVAGTGSMYPTFPKGDKLTPIAQFKQTVATPSFISYPSGVVIFNKRYLGRELRRGDIVSFSNNKTKEITKKEYGETAGFIKRVIGLWNDTIELRGGVVYLNGKALKEPYTAKPQSTFGENFLTECKKIKVPKNHIFVMGDNRKGSGDSREIGFINLWDVEHVLPIENQKGIWDKNWRDTNKDFDKSSKIALDTNEYLKFLNEKRKTAKVKPLVFQEKLIDSASIRANIILKFDDFSFEATKSAVTMLKAMQKVGYSNIVYGEAPTQGYFESTELIENQFQFPKTKDFLLNKDYQEIGVAVVEGEINSCPTQIIVQHFAGYLPPNYSKDLITSWENALESLNEISKSWQELKSYPEAYDKQKENIDRINWVIERRKFMISQILKRMRDNLWLTNEQNQYTKTEDKLLGEEEEVLAKKINNALK